MNNFIPFLVTFFDPKNGTNFGNYFGTIIVNHLKFHQNWWLIFVQFWWHFLIIRFSLILVTFFLLTTNKFWLSFFFKFDDNFLLLNLHKFRWIFWPFFCQSFKISPNFKVTYYGLILLYITPLECLRLILSFTVYHLEHL